METRVIPKYFVNGCSFYNSKYIANNHNNNSNNGNNNYKLVVVLVSIYVILTFQCQFSFFAKLENFLGCCLGSPGPIFEKVDSKL